MLFFLAARMFGRHHVPRGGVRITVFEAKELRDPDRHIVRAAEAVGVNPDVYRARIADGKCPRTGHACPMARYRR